MTNDSGLFQSAEELEADGAYPVAGGTYERGNSRFLPLIVGRAIHIFDHRYASVLEEDAEEVEGDPADEEQQAAQPRRTRRATRSLHIHNPYSSRLTDPAEHAELNFNPRPRYWVDEAELAESWPGGLEWAIAFRDVARPTDVRTVISCIAPRAAFGNTAPLLLPALPDAPRERDRSTEAMATWRAICERIITSYKATATLLVGNLNSMVLDYVSRNKVRSTHLNFYILEQFPFAARPDFARRFGSRSAEEIVREEVLALTYTSHDLTPFARDQGYVGQPFVWDSEDRLRRRARLDAVFMLLYGIDRDTAGYILNMFPILKRQEEDRYDGRYRTRDLVLRYMAAMEAGNPDADVAG